MCRSYISHNHSNSITDMVHPKVKVRLYSYSHKYPELLNDVAAIIQMLGFAVQKRQRTQKATSCDVCLEQISSHVQKQNPGLRVSHTTVHRLILPLHKSHLSSTVKQAVYKGVINVTVP